MMLKAASECPAIASPGESLGLEVKDLTGSLTMNTGFFGIFLPPPLAA